MSCAHGVQYPNLIYKVRVRVRVIYQYCVVKSLLAKWMGPDNISPGLDKEFSGKVQNVES